MYSKVAQILAVASMISFVAAAPSPQNSGQECGNGGVQQCCDSLQDAQSDIVQDLFGRLGLPGASSVTGQVGLTCTPIASDGSSTCNQQTVCCNGNSFHGDVVIACNNINL